uniref:Establishment of sister chromatid cohesion N-acetyltransferase 2 n=1 Tax=Pelusios castaneus TaxID=367368 RepID=A0A8C8VKU4_9SAUR
MLTLFTYFCSVFSVLGTPAKKLMMDFTVGLSPVKTSPNCTFASQTKWQPRLSDEDKENQASPLKSFMSRKLDKSPLQTASIPVAACREFLGKVSPKSGSPYKPIVPAASFYSKERQYLTPLERKLVNESHPLSRKDLLSASRMEKGQGKVNLIRNASSKPPKCQIDTRHTKMLPKSSKKAKVDIAPVKPVVEKERVIRPIEKKMEAPFRVLSMKVKPLLKLPIGAAFFSSGKKSHSGPKKLPSGLRFPQPLSRSAAESDQLRGSVDIEFHSDEKNKVGKASEISKHPAKMVHTFQKSSKKTREPSKDSRDQMIIDAGQKHFGAIICKSCGMIYTAASPEDEAQHIQHHQRFLEGIKYVGWKKERVVAEFWDGKIILVLPGDPKYALKKAEDMRELVDNELGFKQIVLSCPSKIKTYLFVSSEKKIVGCLIAEQIKQAFRVLSESDVPQAPNRDVLQHHRAWRCSTKPEAAICGVSRIWVFSLRRRRGIARRMVDVVRNTFMYGCYLRTDEIAFSDPTPDGKLFATRYCQTPNFLVYNFIS